MYERALVDVSNIRSLLANARPLVAPQNKARFFSLHKSVRALPSKKKKSVRASAVPYEHDRSMGEEWEIGNL